MPFSCSCGAAGCAGIWDGILTKHRLTTVEWRAREEDGYKFLNSFYSFEKDNYYSEVVKAWLQLAKWCQEDVKIECGGSSIRLDAYLKGYFMWEEVAKGMKKLVAMYTL